MARTAERSRPEKGPVALVGFMGSGKSTVGRLLARRLGWQLIDLDREIEARDGRRIPDIFSSCGETYFRELESRLLDEALAGKTSGRPCVISCGGGVILDERNRKRLSETTTIFLEEDPGVLYRRTRGADRPLGAGSRREFERRYASRLPYYREVAGLVVDCARRSPARIAGEVASWLDG